MVLDPQRRASIHERLVRYLGEEDTVAFLDAVDELRPEAVEPDAHERRPARAPGDVAGPGEKFSK